MMMGQVVCLGAGTSMYVCACMWACMWMEAFRGYGSRLRGQMSINACKWYELVMWLECEGVCGYGSCVWGRWICGTAYLVWMSGSLQVCIYPPGTPRSGYWVLGRRDIRSPCWVPSQPPTLRTCSHVDWNSKLERDGNILSACRLPLGAVTRKCACLYPNTLITFYFMCVSGEGARTGSMQREGHADIKLNVKVNLWAGWGNPPRRRTPSAPERWGAPSSRSLLSAMRAFRQSLGITLIYLMRARHKLLF